MKLLEEMKIYNLFISHAWEYNEDYYRLENMLDNVEDFKWRNYSVPVHNAIDSNDDQELEEALRNQIRPTSAVLITSGMYVSYRKWIQKEIDIAIDMDKPIIAVIPWGNQKIPQEVQNVADAIVNWNTFSLVGAIEELSL